MDSIILRFRDLITEEGGTILDHQDLINNHGEVWWGWWMKQYETPPIEQFKFIKTICDEKEYFKAYLFNSGSLKIFRTNIIDIKVAPIPTTIGTPYPEKSPNYYHRGSYPAWFLLSRIDEVKVEEKNILIKDFPTVSTKKKNEARFKNILDKKVTNLEGLRQTDVTMWLVEI
ncbi:MAG: hypothetical protein WD048_13240 [Chitinophagales bacterium]